MFIIQNYFKELKFIFIYVLISITLTTIIFYHYNYETLYIIAKPLIQSEFLPPSFNFIFTDIFEAFKMYLFLSIFMGIHVNIPFIIWNIWKFLLKGFYTYENKIFIFILIITTLLLTIINILFYHIIFPIIIDFLIQFENSNSYNPFNIQIQLKLKDYFIIYIKFTYLFNLTFILPFFTLLIKNNKWIYFKKFIYLLLLIIIALITPPDILSLLLFFLPTIIILELAHFLKKINY